MLNYLLEVTQFTNGTARTQIRSYDFKPGAVSVSHSVTFPSYVILKNNREFLTSYQRAYRRRVCNSG